MAAICSFGIDDWRCRVRGRTPGCVDNPVDHQSGAVRWKVGPRYRVRHLEFEGDAVYLHREDFEYSMEKNSLAIELSDSQGRSWRKLNDHYVIIEGRFSATAQGHFGARAGSLQNVIRLGNWSVRRSSLKRDRNKLLAR